MHILVIHQYFLQKNGSGGSRFNEMTRVWEEKGHKVTVLTGMIYHNSGKKYPEYKGKFIVDEQYSENIRVIRCHDSEGGQKNFIARLWVYLAFVFSSCWAGLFKARDKYDIIVVTSPPLTVGLTAVVLSFLKRTPYIFEIRDLWPESAIDTGVLTNKSIINVAFFLEKMFYKRAKRINVLTPAFRQALTEKKGIAPEKIVFIPNAADFALSEELLAHFDAEAFKKELGLQDKVVITYVGAHGIANNLIQVIQTAQLLRGTNVVFLLIGDGMEKVFLQEEARKNNLSNIVFVPPVSKQDVFKYILASDIGASILKKVDTFKTVYSNKTFDYMACKKPIFMLIDGVSRELVEAAECGLYVEPENPELFAQAIKDYLGKGQEYWKTQGEAGYHYAYAHFDREVLAEQYLKEIEKTLN